MTASLSRHNSHQTHRYLLNAGRLLSRQPSLADDDMPITTQLSFDEVKYRSAAA